ncbi:3,4-dihydroxy-2-butanone-4-phosphate synthase [Tsukamurella spumae]|uniref:3,4-dihydroxy-2-butanone-4-phosphate synthase n=1 Tax=Tsukamurella spumae TaxID=44753 RepID=A0A846X1J9_9ACTN|nr:3,4-dihydroxy-2-butanone-4-phosphate synthase [Tsukamurella spumae]
MSTPQSAHPGEDADDDAARAAFAAGAFVILVDDEGAVLALPAAAASGATVAFAVRHSSGMLHAAAPSALLDALRIPDQCVLASENSGLPFTVAVDAVGVGTGISARDRARTMRVLADPRTVADDLVRPGHVIPVRCSDGGYEAQQRVWERAVDLARAAGSAPVVMMCRLVDANGDVRDGDSAAAFAAAHALPVVRVLRRVPVLQGVE